MKIKSIIAFASAGLLLGSCGIYSKYERPDVNVKGHACSQRYHELRQPALA